MPDQCREQMTLHASQCPLGMELGAGSPLRGHLTRWHDDDMGEISLPSTFTFSQATFSPFPGCRGSPPPLTGHSVPSGPALCVHTHQSAPIIHVCPTAWSWVLLWDHWLT